METIYDLAMAYLELARDNAEMEEMLESDGDNQAEYWHEQAENAEKVIKRHIDTLPKGE